MANKINILYFIPTFDPGGTERIVLDLCNLVSPDKFKVNVCAFYSGEFEKKMKEGQRVFTLVNGNSYPKSLVQKGLNFLKRVRRLNHILEEESIDIIHTHHLGPFLHALVASRRGKGIKWLHTEHQKMDVQVKYSKRMLNTCKYFLKFPDILTGVSEVTSSYFYNDAKVSKDKVFTVLNGVNVNSFSKLGKRISVRKELNVSDEELLIGIVGGLRKEKNHQNLIKAFSIVFTSLAKVRLVIVGDGECREELERLVCDLNIGHYVNFLGYRLDIPELMSAFDVYCLPSFYEGMPLSVIEAWAAGKPVVATDVIGIKELVKNEENGILTPSNNPERLAEGLIRVLTDDKLREKIARNGRKFALENCTVERMIEKYEDIYSGLMNGRISPVSSTIQSELS